MESTPRNILAEADKTINSARPDKYGTVTESFTKIATVCNQIFSRTELNGPMTAEKIAKVLVAMKLVRDSYSPNNPDHLLDACGYIGLLDQIRLARESEPQFGGSFKELVKKCMTPEDDAFHQQYRTLEQGYDANGAPCA